MSRLALCHIVFVLLTVAWVVSTPTEFVLFLSRAGYGGWRLGRIAIASVLRSVWVNMHGYSSMIAFTILGAIRLLVNWRWVVESAEGITTQKSVSYKSSAQQQVPTQNKA